MDERHQRLQLKRQKILNKRPPVISGEPKFFICSNCHNLVIQENATYMDTCFTCCGQKMSELIPKSDGELSEKHLPVLTFTGGISAEHAANVEIGSSPHPMSEEHRIEWIYLRTAQGGQFKRLTVNRFPSASFALTDEDAYAYCNRKVCKNCVFHCKRDFAAYAYCNQHGLWKTQI